MNPTLILAGREGFAAKEFQKYYQLSTQKKLALAEADDGVSNLVVIGGCDVNSAASEFDAKDIRMGSDDYLIRSFRRGTRHILWLAGGRSRSNCYAVYRYFFEFAGAGYFWDGDTIETHAELPLEGINLHRRFRFAYRGQRYFAHRGLERFQAEHWGWTQWKNELEFLLKQEFNLFMLRLGNGDAFQRAFPDFVNYPPDDRRDPEMPQYHYNDRSELWSLRYRGELHDRIIGYAKQLDLLHPVDMGPSTHWYSPSPEAFLKHRKPKFLDQFSKSYSGSSLSVWDFRQNELLEDYWKLTEAEIKRGNPPDIFHTIGLAERKYADEKENFQLKRHAYRSFIGRLRREYPNAPLLIAGWDFMFTWKAVNVRKLLRELDPSNTIVLDYTTDSDFKGNDFRSWGLVRKFPWIFGIFQAYEPQNDLFFDFDRSELALAEVGNDPMCRGMVLWPENSHANVILTEYLSCRASGREFSVESFCRRRYRAAATDMATLWSEALPAFASGAWSFNYARPLLRLFVNHFNLLETMAGLEKLDPNELEKRCLELISDRPEIPGFFQRCADTLSRHDSGAVTRDVFDLTRTMLMRRITVENAKLVRDLLQWRRGADAPPDGGALARTIQSLGNLLALHPDYSMSESIRRLELIHPLCRDTEEVVKGNSENHYCRSYIAEFYPTLYVPEAEFLAKFIAEKVAQHDRSFKLDEKLFAAERKILCDRFRATPLPSVKFHPERLATLLQDL